MPILAVKNIRKSFGAEEILHGIDFSMEKGEVAFHHRIVRQRENHIAAVYDFSGACRIRTGVCGRREDF